MEQQKATSKQSWKKRLSGKRKSRVSENDLKVGSEIDFIADGGGRDTKINSNNHKFKNKLTKSLSSGGKSKERTEGKESTPPSETLHTEILTIIDQIICATSDYISEKSEEISNLKKFGSVISKSVKDIQKLGVLSKSLKCHNDIATVTKKSLLVTKSSTVQTEDMPSLCGVLKLNIAGVIGFSTIKNNDHCEANVVCGNKKYKLKGTVKSEDVIEWKPREILIQPLSFEGIVIKISEPTVLGKSLSIGSASLEMNSLIKAFNQKTNISIGKNGSRRIILAHTWMPFDFNNIPVEYHKKTDANSTTRIRKEDSDRQSYNKNIITDKERSEFPLLMNNDALDEVFLERLEQSASSVMCEKRDFESDENGILHTTEDCKEVWAEAIYVAIALNLVMDSYRGRYQDLQLLETVVLDIVESLGNCVDRREMFILDELKFKIECHEKVEEALMDESLNFKDIGAKFSLLSFNEDQEMAHSAAIAHMRYCLVYLKDVGAYGPLKVKEVIALHRLNYQATILKQIMDVALTTDFDLEDFPELMRRRTLLEFWRSCCDGELELCVSAKILLLEFESEFGRSVRSRHPDVSNKIFPELLRRILGVSEDDINEHSVTIFQLLQFCQEMGTDDRIEDLAKTVDKLGLEMFLTSALRSENQDLILIAIKKVGTLLALRTSNLNALAHLLLRKEKEVRAAAAAHIIHIGKDISLQDKALISFVELLESPLKRDRQSSCVALGFLGAKESIPQLSYLYHSDVDVDVREAAAEALIALGDEGKLSLEHAASTLLAQTMTQRMALKTSMRLGTAL